MIKYYKQIDILKGLAIISVIIEHSINHELYYNLASSFHIGQAVPVFLVIMGFNFFMSFERKSNANLFSKSYLVGKFKRIIIPFIFFYLIAIIIVFFRPQMIQKPVIMGLMGWLPFWGPGDYFINLSFQFILFGPLIYWLFKRNPTLTLIGSFVINLLYDIIQMNGWDIVFITQTGFDIKFFSLIHYISYIILGFWIAWGKGMKIVIPIGFIISFLYLVHSQIWPNDTFYFWDGYKNENLISSFYSAVIVITGLKFIPIKSNIVTNIVSYIGKSSYHILFAQIFYFVGLSKLFYNRAGLPLIVTLFNVITCVVLGIIFYKIEHRVMNKKQI